MRFADAIVDVPQDSPWHAITGTIVLTVVTVFVAIAVRWIMI